jgi:hypothetical protein
MRYQQLDLQSLIELLAEETQLYTRAFIGGQTIEAAWHKATIDALVEEIKRRKNEPHTGLKISSDDATEASR